MLADFSVCDQPAAAGCSGRGQDLGAFLASSLYLVGMLASMAFGVFPNDAVILMRRIPPKITVGYYNCIIRRARNHDQAGAV
jgi:hypothetical protein